MIIQASTHGAKRGNLVRALQDHKPFRTSGALNGYQGNDGITGGLYGDDLDQYRKDANKIIYVVRSYATPIAWITSDGKIHHVAQRFSVTTTRHQSVVRCYLK